MNPSVGTVRNEEGVALPLALFVLVSLTGLVLAFLSMAGMEPQVSRNLSDTARARYAAEAGMEWAYDQLASAPAAGPTSWNGRLGAPSNGVMATNMSLPGLAATFGTFSVTIRNDVQPADPQITGQPVDPSGNPTIDQNGVVIVTATGTFNGVTRQIQEVVTRLNLQVPGAMNLYGFGINTVFNGNSFTISGNDTNPDGTAGACPSNWGISVADAVTEQAVQTTLTPQQKDNITGKPQAAGPGQGDNTIAPDATLTPSAITKFVNDVKPYANLSLQSSALNKVSVTNLGNTCATNWNDGNCWGTPSNPKIVYIKGTPDPAQLFFAASIAGTSTGAGILIIEDGDLDIGGNFHWEGLILITGQYAGLRYGGGGNQSIYGGAVVNETVLGNTEVELKAEGNPKVYYSCQAIANAANSRALTRVTSWREL